MTRHSVGGNPPMPWRWNLNLNRWTDSSKSTSTTVAGEFRASMNASGKNARTDILPAAMRQRTNEPGFQALLNATNQTRQARSNIARGETRSGEPVFVPRSASSAEDDGWVSRVVRLALDRSEMVCSTPKILPQARCASELQHRVPWGFHGKLGPAA